MNNNNRATNNSGFVGILHGSGHCITNNDMAAMEGMVSQIIALMEKKDDQVAGIIDILKTKFAVFEQMNGQLSDVIGILKSKNDQIDRLIGLIERTKNTHKEYAHG